MSAKCLKDNLQLQIYSIIFKYQSFSFITLQNDIERFILIPIGLKVI